MTGLDLRRIRNQIHAKYSVEFPSTLEVNDDGGHFSLCQLNNGDDFVVVYKALASSSSSASAGFNFTTCTDILVSMNFNGH